MKKNTLRNILSTLLILLLVFCLGQHLWSTRAHEEAGTLMFIFFILHNVLNFQWYKNLFKGKYTPMRWLMTITVLLVFVDMVVLVYSSLVISRYVFTFLPDLGSMATARRLHLLSAYWAVILMSLHFGLHWAKFMNLLPLPSRVQNGKKAIYPVVKAVGAAIALYGAYVFVDRNCLDYLLLDSPFVFVDGMEGAWEFYLDYFALMGTCVFLAYYGLKLVQGKLFAKS